MAARVPACSRLRELPQSHVAASLSEKWPVCASCSLCYSSWCPPSLLWSFPGDDRCFLFSVSPSMAVYTCTGYNDHYMYLNHGQQTIPNGLVRTWQSRGHHPRASVLWCNLSQYARLTLSPASWGAVCISLCKRAEVSSFCGISASESDSGDRISHARVGLCRDVRALCVNGSFGQFSGQSDGWPVASVAREGVGLDLPPGVATLA